MPRRLKLKKSPSGTRERSNTGLSVHAVSEARAHRSFVFFGRSGTGKTTLAATFPKPMLLLDVNDQGTDSIANVAGIDVLSITDWDDFEKAYWWIKEHPDHYKTLAVDTITQLQQVGIEKVQRDKGKQGKTGWGAVTKQEWGSVAGLMKSWIINVRDLPLQTVFLAQDRVFNVEGEDEAVDSAIDPEVGPRLSPSISAHLNAAVSVIGCTFIRQHTKKVTVAGKRKEVGRIQYCLRIGPNPVYVTKIRKPKEVRLPSTITDPTYDDLMEIISGSV